jgi:ribosomal protein S14
LSKAEDKTQTFDLLLPRFYILLSLSGTCMLLLFDWQNSCCRRGKNNLLHLSLLLLAVAHKQAWGLRMCGTPTQAGAQEWALETGLGEFLCVHVHCAHGASLAGCAVSIKSLHMLLKSHGLLNHLCTCTLPHSPFSPSVRSRVCGNTHGMIRKYGLNICRQCFREYATDIGFIKVGSAPFLCSLCGTASQAFHLLALRCI